MVMSDFEEEFDSDDEEGKTAYAAKNIFLKKKQIELKKRKYDSLRLTERMMKNQEENIT